MAGAGPAPANGPNGGLGRLIGAIDGFNAAIARVAAWGLLALALLQAGLVLARYVFAARAVLWVPTLWLQEIVVFLFGFCIALAMGDALRAGAHVRIDIFSERLGARGRAAVDLLGALGLLLPVCALIWIAAWPNVLTAWATLEGSGDAGGLPGRFLLKTAIAALAFLLALQAIAEALRAADRLGAASARP